MNYPILSFFTSQEYNDIPIPLPYDIKYIFADIYFPDINCNIINKNKLQLKWKNKINKVLFRGYLTGEGNNNKNNIIIKAYEIGLQNKDILDIGIFDYKKQMKKNKNEPLISLKILNDKIKIESISISDLKKIIEKLNVYTNNTVEIENKYFNDLLEDKKLFEQERLDAKDIDEQKNWDEIITNFDNIIINELTENFFKEEEFEEVKEEKEAEEESKEEKEAENKKTKKRSASHLFS